MLMIGSLKSSVNLKTRVWACSSAWLERTPDKREVDGSTPSRPTILWVSYSKVWDLNQERHAPFGGVAQLGERLPCTQEVIGSNPFTSTICCDCIIIKLFFDNLAISTKKTFSIVVASILWPSY